MEVLTDILDCVLLYMLRNVLYKEGDKRVNAIYVLVYVRVSDCGSVVEERRVACVRIDWSDRILPERHDTDRIYLDEAPEWAGNRSMRVYRASRSGYGPDDALGPRFVHSDDLEFLGHSEVVEDERQFDTAITVAPPTFEEQPVTAIVRASGRGAMTG